MAATATQRQSSSRISSHSSVQLTPFIHHTSQATESTSVTIMITREVRLDSGGGGDMLPKNHDTRGRIAAQCGELSQIEQAESGQARGLQQLLLEILLFEHGELGSC